MSNNRVEREALRQHRRIWLIGSGALVFMLLAVAIAYVASPYLMADHVVNAVARKTLPETLDDSELASIASNIHEALSQVVQCEPSESGTLGQRIVGALVQSVCGSVLEEVARQLTSRQGIQIALYGWQALAEKTISFEKRYAHFPDLFSIAMNDASDGAPLVELFFVRDGLFEWKLVAIRPQWLRTQGMAGLRRMLSEIGKRWPGSTGSR